MARLVEAESFGNHVHAVNSSLTITWTARVRVNIAHPAQRRKHPRLRSAVYQKEIDVTG